MSTCACDHPKFEKPRSNETIRTVGHGIPEYIDSGACMAQLVYCAHNHSRNTILSQSCLETWIASVGIHRFCGHLRVSIITIYKIEHTRHGVNSIPELELELII